QSERWGSERNGRSLRWKVPQGGAASKAGHNASERRAGLETFDAGADPAVSGGRPPWTLPREQLDPCDHPAGEVAMACLHRENGRNTGDLRQWVLDPPNARDVHVGLAEEWEGCIGRTRPGNAGRGQGPWFKVNVRSGDSREIGVSLQPPAKVGKLQETLHAKAKSAPMYRFYLLYDKVYRADVLEYAYRCCRVNDGTAGAGEPTFADHPRHDRARSLWTAR